MQLQVVIFQDWILQEWFNSILDQSKTVGKRMTRTPETSLGETMSYLMKKEEYNTIRQARENTENTVESAKVLTLLLEDESKYQEALEKNIEEFEKIRAEKQENESAEMQWKYRLARCKMLNSAEVLEDVVKRAEIVEEKLKARTREPRLFTQILCRCTACIL